MTRTILVYANNNGNKPQIRVSFCDIYTSTKAFMQIGILRNED